ncbi:MAG: hypothetical protein M0Z73_11400 [Betaproteobacteria bacterium]|nr:hypothetical protein [Betaproteobacteria bacterium]
MFVKGNATVLVYRHDGKCALCCKIRLPFFSRRREEGTASVPDAAA